MVSTDLATIIILGNLVIFAASLLQAVAGFGFAMIAIPCMALIDISLVPGVSLVTGLIISVIMYFDERDEVDWREIRILVPVVIIGTVIGAGLALMLPLHLAGMVFSSAILIAIVATIFTPPVALNGWTLGAGGMAAGIMGTVSGLHGPANGNRLPASGSSQDKGHDCRYLHLRQYLLDYGAFHRWQDQPDDRDNGARISAGLGPGTFAGKTAAPSGQSKTRPGNGADTGKPLSNPVAATVAITGLQIHPCVIVE
ncbi:MAG: sulfite exporter TauE/SafE family protein [Nitratireductor sp.]